MHGNKGEVDAVVNEARGAGMSDLPIQVGKPCRWCGKRDDYHPFFGLRDGTALCPECWEALAVSPAPVQRKSPITGSVPALPSADEPSLSREWLKANCIVILLAIITAFLGFAAASIVLVLVALGGVVVFSIRGTRRTHNVLQGRRSGDLGGTGAS